MGYDLDEKLRFKLPNVASKVINVPEVRQFEKLKENIGTKMI